jgi:hypothetical protein
MDGFRRRFHHNSDSSAACVEILPLILTDAVLTSPICRCYILRSICYCLFVCPLYFQIQRSFYSARSRALADIFSWNIHMSIFCGELIPVGIYGLSPHHDSYISITGGVAPVTPECHPVNRGVPRYRANSTLAIVFLIFRVESRRLLQARRESYGSRSDREYGDAS